MSKRALFVFDWRRLDAARLSFIQQQTAAYDELIFLLPDADALPAEENSFCGQLLVQLQKIFSTTIDRPFYLLPAPAKGAGLLQQWLRWRILCPSFIQVFIDQPGMAATMENVLHAPVSFQAFATGQSPLLPVLQVASVRRGLFITRAQPFHNGHVAFIQQMSEEMEEVIVVIAMANRSHQPADIAMAGERLAMTAPQLNRLVPARHYLVALPYNDYSMENLYELEYLLPSFQYVYTSNPGVAAMAATAGYEVKHLQQQLTVSSTMVRECMLQGNPYDQYVPAGVHHFLQEAGMPARLQLINTKENR